MILAKNIEFLNELFYFQKSCITESEFYEFQKFKYVLTKVLCDKCPKTCDSII